eukprot:CAMPEP_0194046626 /NCGR_PEP_ID=MMETSP0009_2-20130614/22006_1 /TAXON_ID=210454 /ORGANISM="Grammatophora oceanica, Strain CCMP 410" /LENGTH=196 /DNA_ID=CAMNT_0038691995 /DNA_START=64 /DNA_END=654 /DNA_ORIENTATION=+
MTQRKATQDDQIRAKLLNRLGIYESIEGSNAPATAAQNRRLRILRGMGVGYTIKPSPPDGSAVRPPLGGVASHAEPLKTGSSASPTTRRNKSSKIAFQDEVDVIPIPMRTEYSDRIKSRIWSNRFELQENAKRNAVEFAAEGWDWRTVTEDENMYICSVSGELVHPVHCQHLVSDEVAATSSPDSTLERGETVYQE